MVVKCLYLILAGNYAFAKILTFSLSPYIDADKYRENFFYILTDRLINGQKSALPTQPK